jgi:hypothetical protein
MNHFLSAVAVVAALAWPAVLSAQAPAILPVCDANAEDHDGDGMSTVCELEFARLVAPTLVVSPGGCNWDSAAAQIGGGYFYGAQPTDSTVRIVYLPAYFRDCGWQGVKCWLPRVDCSPHDGDSEFIAIDLSARGDGSWSITGVFLSAHCFGNYDKACHWYRGKDLARFEFNGSSAIVWVAEGRNANYPSSRDCDRGLHSIDTCDRNTARYTFPIKAARNIGSRTIPASQHGCVDGSVLETDLVASATSECFWSLEDRFAGWQAGATGVTPYARYLGEIAGF